LCLEERFAGQLKIIMMNAKEAEACPNVNVLNTRIKPNLSQVKVKTATLELISSART
jgi:hypothetical protein